MLKQRVVTAVVLLVVLMLAVTVARPWGFPVLALLMVGAAIWEWMGLMKQPPARATLIASMSCVLLGLANLGVSIDNPWVLAVLGGAAAIWLALALGLMVTGGFPPVDRMPTLYGIAGIVLPAACYMALLASYRRSLVFMISVLALVWIADIAAYFVGRAWGRTKLAPLISPGKTREGALGGLAAVCLIALGVALFGHDIPFWQETFFVHSYFAWPVWVDILAWTLLVGLSIVGDLFESHLKRHAQVKDSSHLLPGHGGVLDRIDALLPVVPVAYLLSRNW